MVDLGWADVDDDLLILLAERVPGVTSFIRFSIVCKAWHTIASISKCSNPVPWLILASKEGSELTKYYDHSIIEVYQFPLPQSQGRRYVGSAHGWLITSDVDGHDLSLFNLITGKLIHLPSLPKFSYYSKLQPRKATCSPIGPDGDCIVAIIYMTLNNQQPHLSFCRSSEKWTDVSSNLASKINDVEYVGGDFYAVTFRYVYRCEFGSNTLFFTKICDLPRERSKYIRSSYILGCGSDVLIILKVANGEVFYEFKVFKLDKEGHKLIEVYSIGNYAVLMGPKNSICMPTGGDLFKRSCLYYKSDTIREVNTASVNFGTELNNVSVYDLENKSFSFLSTNVSLVSFPAWIIINPIDVNVNCKV